MDSWQRARLSRDPRFDGVFFVAVTSTGIFCRPICPAPAAKEQNVEYFANAGLALAAGFRPCIRCRPEASPQSPAWQGVQTTVARAIKLIDSASSTLSCVALADKLGIGERYLRQLFAAHLGLSPKQYMLMQQCFTAKQLLQHSQLSITDIAFASGFNSVRRFNDEFQRQLHLTPTALRQTRLQPESMLRIPLSYRPPMPWRWLQRFLAQRLVAGVEWVTEQGYGRSFAYQGATGQFYIAPDDAKPILWLTLQLSDLSVFRPVVANIRRLFDLDASPEDIDGHLRPLFIDDGAYLPGIRLVGTWSRFEAGIRAICGQQVTVKAAHQQLSELTLHLGEVIEPLTNACSVNYLAKATRRFPTPQAIANSDLAFLKMPGKRKAALQAFAALMAQNPEATAEQWLAVPGIGPWTLNYATMRGQSDPDIYLACDVAVQKALQAQHVDVNHAAPWRSYLTFSLWHTLAAANSPNSSQEK